jgi:hypothetical protein
MMNWKIVDGSGHSLKMNYTESCPERVRKLTEIPTGTGELGPKFKPMSYLV